MIFIHTHTIITTSNMKIIVFNIQLNTLIPLYILYYFISQYLQLLVPHTKPTTWTEIRGKLYTSRSCFTPVIFLKNVTQMEQKSPFTTVYFLGVRGFITSSYIVYNYTTSADMDLQSTYVMHKD